MNMKGKRVSLSFIILFLNIQCLRNKIDLLNSYLLCHNISVICLSEHWFRNCEVNQITLDNFVLGNCYSRINNKNGGMIIYVNMNIKTQRLELENFCSEIDFEICGAVIKELK